MVLDPLCACYQLLSPLYSFPQTPLVLEVPLPEIKSLFTYFQVIGGLGESLYSIYIESAHFICSSSSLLFLGGDLGSFE